MGSQGFILMGDSRIVICEICRELIDLDAPGMKVVYEGRDRINAVDSKRALHSFLKKQHLYNNNPNALKPRVAPLPGSEES